MQKLDPIIVAIIIIALVVLGAVVVVANSSKEKPTAQYQSTDASRPELVIGETNFDFGNMRVEETKTQEVPIQNKGAKSLVISDPLTSCDCTFVQFIIEGIESQKFDMKRDPSWRGEIAPGQSGVAKIIYEPRIMPVKGVVKREIVFKTNDPAKPLVNLRFVANVEE